MDESEIIVRMREGGFTTTMTEKMLRDAVLRELRKGFEKKGRKWAKG